MGERVCLHVPDASQKSAYKERCFLESPAQPLRVGTGLKPENGGSGAEGVSAEGEKAEGGAVK